MLKLYVSSKCDLHRKRKTRTKVVHVRQGHCKVNRYFSKKKEQYLLRNF